ncbi:metallophosphoesterase [Entomomonas asaccharolytica]|uniref:Metallophosphoesterase n=1 Tax=Entomomonas asaccharolytica TaxID=2785331 RepID=A0A974NGL9_9GAMM|nr:metallophosphoesterase [Entomomonas asaccharolytica]QQP86245.1 metallophosphoesterase [Entomomonas asaccharolytica]
MISLSVTFLEFLAVYFGWLCFPVIILCIYLIKKRRYKKSSFLILILSLAFFWAHYIEPQIILVKETTIAKLGFNADVILIADLHLGYYKDQHYLQRIIDKINNIPADYVVIAGDFLYKSDEKYYNTHFAPLAKINKPVYAVRGNHDYRYINRNLPKVLENYNVKIIEDKIIDLNSYQLAGLKDRVESFDDTDFLKKAAKNKPTLVIAHNPDSSDKLSAYNVPLLLAGHTHCGQVRIPLSNKLIVKTRYGLVCGYYDASITGTPVFVTAGVGENNLPLRLFNPPTIDVLHLRY